jgi:UDP-glucose 4-epimerase
MGSHLAEILLDRGHKVTVLDDMSGGFPDNVDPRAKLVEGSVTDSALIKEVFDVGKFEHVFHLAAYAAEGLSHFIKKFNYENNLIGSVNLINAAVNHDVRSFIFTSSIAVYGANQVPMVEEMTPMPEDSYGIAKYAVEQELKVSHEMFGLDYVIFRPHNVYGERQNIGDRYRNVVGIFMNQIMQNQPLTVFGDGEQTRAFSYIHDVVPAIAAAPFTTEARNQVFNVGADEACSVNRLAEIVGKAMGRAPKLNHLPARNEVKHAFSSHGKLKEVFKTVPRFGIEEGVERMAAWAQEVGPRSSKRFEGIEIMKNMPPSWRKELAAAP